jgi:hypothetical protein
VVFPVCSWGTASSFWWCRWGLSVGSLNQWGLDSILGYSGLERQWMAFSFRAKRMFWSLREITSVNSNLSSESYFLLQTSFYITNTGIQVVITSTWTTIFGIVLMCVDCVLASPRITQADPGQWTPLRGGSVTSKKLNNKLKVIISPLSKTKSESESFTIPFYGDSLNSARGLYSNGHNHCCGYQKHVCE